MNREILIYKGVFQRLTVSQNLQILHAIHKEAQPYVMRAPGVQPVFETFGTELSNLDSFFKKNSKAFETEEIVKKDAARDFTVRATLAKVQYHYDFAMTGVEKEEARRLVFIVEKYKDAAKKEYESETAHLRSMVNELLQAPDLLERFGIAGLVARLKQENEEFEILYNARAQTVHDKQLKGNTSKYRTAANSAFDNLCKVVTGLQLMPVSEDEKTAVESIVDIINGQIRQATAVYNRHAGVLAGKKTGKDGEIPEIDEGKETEVLE
ncbi:MAG: DUF6261 family protein [Prevotellaceae bacterium]|jgi:hypothetical protein|nr:DUF6261 family protein [Prevotellaceae bacterium]